MSLSSILSESTRGADVLTPAQRDQFDALVAACALVANADGWVTRDERGHMLERMRGLPALSRFGFEEALEAFEALDRRFQSSPEEAQADAEAAIRRLRGRTEASRTLVNSASAVASADGGLDAEEREVLLRICAILALDPVQFDLETRERRR